MFLEEILQTQIIMADPTRCEQQKIDLTWVKNF